MSDAHLDNDAQTTDAELLSRLRDGDANAYIELWGSSDIRWGSWGEPAGGEEHAEPVVVAVAEAAGEAAVQLDDPVHGLSAAVR